jgi:hypothetical protein
LFFKPQLEVPTDFRGVARGPGAFHEGAAGMGVASFGDRTLMASLSTGVLRGDEPQEFHELSGSIEAGEVSEFRDGRHRHGELHPAQRLQSLDHGIEPPAFDLILEFRLQTRKALGLFIDRPHICLEDDLLGGSGTDHFAQPTSVGWTPGGPAYRADIMPQQKRFEAKLGGLEIPQHILTGATEVADGLVLDRRHIDRRDFPSPHEPGTWDGITAVGFDPVPSLFGDYGGRDDPTDIAFSAERAIEPVATRPRFVDKDQVLSLGVELVDELVEITLACSDGTEEDNLRGMVLGHVGHGDGLFLDIQANRERARL